jgi:D-alanine-D-alanine ligase
MKLKEKKIGVLMGGLSCEREISLASGNAVLAAVKRKGLNGVGIDVSNDISFDLNKNKIDIAFIALHGIYGEDGSIQGLLEYEKIPYTGPGILASALAYDKVKSKEIFKFNKIPTADYQVFYREENKKYECILDFPVVVKPSNQGSSIGVSIVKEEKEWVEALELAFRYSREILIEKFIKGKLLAIGMNGDQPMPIVHIEPKSDFYDYEAKYASDKTEYTCPADLTIEETEHCKDVAVKVYSVLRGYGITRVDLILDAKGVPYVLEMNTIPGMTQTSLLPMAAKKSGIEFDDLVIEILKFAQLNCEG